jgi:aminoglycoside 6'-N-acetyltransferase I
MLPGFVSDTGKDKPMDNNERFIILDETYLTQMTELYRSAFMREPWNDDWSRTEQLAEYIRDISECRSSLNYGLIIDGKLAALSIGTVRHWWEGTNYAVEEFCVSPGMQHQGLGTRFLKMIEEDILRRGISGIFLQTENDKPSYLFYRKNGFDEMTSHVSFYKRLNK